jgi:hypothetical protein
MAGWHSDRFLRWGFISCAALGACSPVRGFQSDKQGGETIGARAGADAPDDPASKGARGGKAGEASIAKESSETEGEPARDAAADEEPSTSSDAGPEPARGGAGARAAPVAAGRSAAGSGGATPGAAAGGGGASGAGGPAPRPASGGLAGSGSLASLPEPAPLKRPTVCPAMGEVQLNWRNAMIPLPGSGSEFLHLLGDGECPGSPRASAVSAKLQLVNRTNTTQSAECWLSSTKSSDYIQVLLAPRAIGSVFLQIASPAGGNERSNTSTVMCRNAGPAAGEVAATWIKLATEALSETELREVP